MCYLDTSPIYQSASLGCGHVGNYKWLTNPFLSHQLPDTGLRELFIKDKNILKAKS